ncbi:carcinoembryonic antigen-related cell adhesion molecule 21-like [Talpa occidentalis]|uniref:carcinoembryonic antigen-related cell adhesion molecule 21-like n=1 Tax=Talpa occidentalis TaxID=50954 RepID=UPI00188E1D22|nr:carcinoembryonic antigen-related cell adhesion molecule 21-like [Talpa occidentalis]
MEAHSDQKYRGRVPWQGLLLAVSLYIFWVPSTDGRFIFESKQIHGTKNTHVIIRIQNQQRNVTRYNWFKGDSRNVNNQIASYIVKWRKMIPGQAYNPRQTISPDGALKIKNVTKEDSGYYTIQTILTKYKKGKASTHLFFLDPLTSIAVQERQTKVRAYDTVAIICLRSQQGDTMHWLINDQKLRLKDNMVLSQDQTLLTIKSIKRENAGQYHCMYLNTSRSRTSERLILEVV